MLALAMNGSALPEPSKDSPPEKKEDTTADTSATTPPANAAINQANTYQIGLLKQQIEEL